jgi:hypothetical protein
LYFPLIIFILILVFLSIFLSHIYLFYGGEGKAVPVQAWIGPEGSRILRLPGFSDIRHRKVARSLALHTGHLYSRKNSGYSFLLEAKHQKD